MSIGTTIGKIFGSGVGEIVESVGNTVDRFITTPDEAHKFKLELMEKITKGNEAIAREVTAATEAKSKIMVAELQSGDNYTRRARPTIVYVGLGAIVFNYCFIPFMVWAATLSQFMWGEGSAAEGWATTIPTTSFDLPPEFWYTWSAVCGIYAIGRSAERRGASNKVLEMIMGKKD